MWKSWRRDGLPQSIMFTGNLYDEAAALRVALDYERETQWRLMHPPTGNA